MARVTWPNEPPREEPPDGTWARPTDGATQDPPPAEPYQPPPASEPYQPPPAAEPYQPPPVQPAQAGGPQPGPGQAPSYQPYPGQQPYPGAPYGPATTNGLAIAALVCSLAGVITVISAPVGAVLGHLSLREIGRTGQEGRGLAVAAIWVGWVITGLVLLGCCGVIALWRTAVPMR